MPTDRLLTDPLAADSCATEPRSDARTATDGPGEDAGERPGEESPARHGLAALAAVLAGLLVSSQGAMNGELSGRTGEPLEAALWSFGSGLSLLTVLVLAVPSMRRGAVRIRTALRSGDLRWWQCVGGLAGGLFVAVQTSAVPLIGVALFTVATVAGQTANGLAVDRLGLGPGGARAVRATRVVAAALAVGGVTVAVSDRLGDVGVAVVPVLLALLAGALVAMQQGTNGRVTIASRHVLSTTWLNFATGAALLVVLAGVESLSGAFTPRTPGAVPWWAWFGGLCGIGFVAIASWAVRHLGVLVFGLALLTGQLGSAVLIDLLNPATRGDVGPRVLLGVGITFVAAALAGWFARPRRQRSADSAGAHPG